jgi:transposase InsO family protein
LPWRKSTISPYGEIETAHPGYLGSQDTFYVGPLKGVGRIYQQTFVDTYSKVAFTKLYTTKTPITAADLLNDKVLPYFAEQNVPVLRILTDRGTEYCGKLEQHFLGRDHNPPPRSVGGRIEVPDGASAPSER